MAIDPSFDRGTQPFLKIDMRHKAYRHEEIYYQNKIGPF